MNVTEHLFDCLAEEGGEVVQAAMKVNRFHPDGCYPDGRGNIEVVIAELNDLYAVVELLIERGIELPGLGDRDAIEAKKKKVASMMLVAVSRGSLQFDGRN